MARAFRHRGLTVYVGAERGQPHHLPHVHIQRGGEIVWSLILPTLQPLHDGPPMPKWLVRKLEEELEPMLAIWERLNDERV